MLLIHNTLCKLAFLEILLKCIISGSSEGASCKAMSSAKGICTTLDDCPLYKEVKFPLQYGFIPPYYFKAKHDFMNCGQADGPNTLICCDKEAIEMPPTPNIPVPPHCGVQVASIMRIIGGVPVTQPGTFPWLAELMYRSPQTGEQKWMCAGSLISRKHILTAAHCAFPVGFVMYKARIGALYLNQTGDYWQDHLIANVKVHEAYDKNKKLHDIAIVLLTHEVTITPFVHPICLPYQSSLRSETFEGKHPFVAGWGVTSYGGKISHQLLQIQIAVGSNKQCASVLKPLGRTITPMHICSTLGDGVRDACQGDSGGPLMQPLHGYFYVTGVISYGYLCAMKGYPSINTRVTEYIDWIAGQINS